MNFQPEIVDDALYNAIVNAVCYYKPKTIVEIGSANGLGSTQAFIEGIIHSNTRDECMLHCVELNSQRFEELVTNTEKSDVNITYHNGSTVSFSQYMSDEEVQRVRNVLETLFIDKIQYPLSLMLEWKKEELMLLSSAKIVSLPRDADMVLIDGSGFCAEAELKLFDNPKAIILDDVIDIKNFTNYNILLNSPKYHRTVCDLNLRNGYAIFERLK